jgi:tRNA(Glu) U13 pseudouridine synthase TruD
LLTGNYFKAYKRPIIVKPNDFNISEPIKDEINNNQGRIHYSIKTSYFLPKGSYATIITKRIFYI